MGRGTREGVGDSSSSDDELGFLKNTKRQTKRQQSISQKLNKRKNESQLDDIFKKIQKHEKKIKAAEESEIARREQEKQHRQDLQKRAEEEKKAREEELKKEASQKQVTSLRFFFASERIVFRPPSSTLDKDNATQLFKAPCPESIDPKGVITKTKLHSIVRDPTPAACRPLRQWLKRLRNEQVSREEDEVPWLAPLLLEFISIPRNEHLFLLQFDAFNLILHLLHKNRNLQLKPSSYFDALRSCGMRNVPQNGAAAKESVEDHSSINAVHKAVPSCIDLVLSILSSHLLISPNSFSKEDVTKVFRNLFKLMLDKACETVNFAEILEKLQSRQGVSNKVLAELITSPDVSVHAESHCLILFSLDTPELSGLVGFRCLYYLVKESWPDDSKGTISGEKIRGLLQEDEVLQKFLNATDRERANFKSITTSNGYTKLEAFELNGDRDYFEELNNNLKNPLNQLYNRIYYLLVFSHAAFQLVLSADDHSGQESRSMAKNWERINQKISQCEGRSAILERLKFYSNLLRSINIRLTNTSGLEEEDEEEH